MAGLNPEILTWARQSAGLDLETAARKIGLKAAHGQSGADRLAELEAGAKTPSPTQLRKMSAQYHRPLLTFYLPAVPAPPELGHDFRTLPDRGDPANVLLDTLLRDVKARQTLVREAIEDGDNPQEVGFVGAFNGERDADRLCREVVAAIDFNRSEFRARQTVEDAFAYLRGLVEKQGVFVLLAGDCGSWQSAIDVNIFRGFAIADPFAPFIVINDQDAKSAWSFTLIHELAHLLLGETGISGGVPNGGIEQLCNDTAAAILISREEFTGIPLDGSADDKAAITQLATRSHVSRSMVAYQLFRVGMISQVHWQELRDTFRAEWIAFRNSEREKNRASDGGPNWYVVRRHRLGAALLNVARQGIADGSLTPTRAARMLGVKPMNIYPLIAEPRRARLS